jgi:8-oxo-dGTP pyrophosphatase MutT (NUDIX family)
MKAFTLIMDKNIEQFKKRVETVLRQDRHRILRTDLTRAAVLIPILARDGEPHLILTKRTMNVATHKGQISFPGGIREPDDKNATENALREAQEEINLHPDMVTVVGPFDDFITTSGFNVTPVVGFVTSDASLRPNPMEVAEIITAPVADFTNPAHHAFVTEKNDDGSRHYHSYRIEDHLIWGATAGIIHHLLKEMDALDKAV